MQKNKNKSWWSIYLWFFCFYLFIFLSCVHIGLVPMALSKHEPYNLALKYIQYDYFLLGLQQGPTLGPARFPQHWERSDASRKLSPPRSSVPCSRRLRPSLPVLLPSDTVRAAQLCLTSLWAWTDVYLQRGYWKCKWLIVHLELPTSFWICSID